MFKDEKGEDIYKGMSNIKSLEVKIERRNRKKRADSVGLPDSPYQIMLMNIAKEKGLGLKTNKLESNK